eukprot:jgi/Undpi1/12138/HiC_scaffold_5.g01814.m1
MPTPTPTATIASPRRTDNSAPGARAEAQNIQRQTPPRALNRGGAASSPQGPSSSSFDQFLPSSSSSSSSSRTNGDPARVPVSSGTSRSPTSASSGPTLRGTASVGRQGTAPTDAQRTAWAPRGYDDLSPAGSNAAAGFAGQPEYANSPEYWQEYDGDGAGVGRQGYAGDDSYGAGGQAGGREQQPFREYGAGGGYPGQGVPQGQPVPDSRGYYPGEKGYRPDQVPPPPQQGQGGPGQEQGGYMEGAEAFVPDGYGGFVRRQNPQSPQGKKKGGGGVGGFFRRLAGRKSKPPRSPALTSVLRSLGGPGRAGEPGRA